MDENQVTCASKINRPTISTLGELIVPGLHVSKIYSPFTLSSTDFSSSGGTRGSKPVPPVGRRTKRLVMGVVRCEPGRKERAPFSAVHRSRGIQKPSADGGLVYWSRTKGQLRRKVRVSGAYEECPVTPRTMSG